jgi:hypothetical protein
MAIIATFASASTVTATSINDLTLLAPLIARSHR